MSDQISVDGAQPELSPVMFLLTRCKAREDAGYLTREKTGNGTASRTSIGLTGRRRAALKAYTATLRGLLAGL